MRKIRKYTSTLEPGTPLPGLKAIDEKRQSNVVSLFLKFALCPNKLVWTEIFGVMQPSEVFD